MREQMDDPVTSLALLGEPTRRRLYEYVAASVAPVSRDEAAAGLAISRELAAFHLDRLAAAGLLETEFKRLGGRRGPGAGRPAKLYRRAERDMTVSLPHRDYERAAEILAEAVDRVDGESVRDTVGELARGRGEAAGAEARRSAGRRPSRRRVDGELLELLRGEGYEPQLEPGSGTVRLRNCPYHALVSRHRDLTCGMNLAWAQGIVDGLGDPKLEAKLAPIAGYCCVVFERPSE